MEEKQCEGCGKHFDTTRQFRKHIRAGDDCPIYYKISYLTYKLRPDKECNAIWKTYKDHVERVKLYRHADAQEIDSGACYQRGIPSEDTYAFNGKYIGAAGNKWLCV